MSRVVEVDLVDVSQQMGTGAQVQLTRALRRFFRARFGAQFGNDSVQESSAADSNSSSRRAAANSGLRLKRSS